MICERGGGQCPRKEMACIISRFGGIKQKVDNDLVSISKFMMTANFFSQKCTAFQVSILKNCKIEAFCECQERIPYLFFQKAFCRIDQ